MNEILIPNNKFMDRPGSSVNKEAGNAFSFASSSSQMEEIFNALMYSSPIGIYIIQDSKFSFVSRKFSEILGYAQNELIGSDALNYVYPDDRVAVRANATEALKSGYCRPYEYRVKDKVGDVRWVLETVISIHYQGKRATLGNFMDINEDKKIQAEMQITNEKLTTMVKIFEKQNRLDKVLSDMRDLLQACSTISEIAPIIMSSMKKLFPAAAGALFLMSPSRSDLESVARWGGFSDDIDDNVFSPDACWGLRRGHAHVVEDPDIGPICPHLIHKPNSAYVCLPLMAKGDLLGLLHLRNSSDCQDNESEQSITELKETAITISEYLSLAIANVKLSESLSKQSVLDTLSGLHNRRYMEESFEREIQRAKRKYSQIGVIMADLDLFKEFNDKYGHAAGDMVISQVGNIFKKGVRGSDIACRYGGEEFVLILPDCSTEDTVRRANLLREEVENLNIIFQGQVMGSLTVSMGIACYPNNATSIDGLLREADIALYKAKQGGRNRVFSNGLT